MRKWELDLMLFGEGGGVAGGAGDGGAGGSAEGTPGEGVLEDGTRVDHRLAERMQKQRERHHGRTGGEAILAGQNGNTAGTGADATGNGANRNAGNPAQAQNAKTPEEEFDELIKGKYRSQYQARFQQGISERFKNQANLQQQLDGLKPMLDALAKQRGVEAGDYEALSKNILDDDSLYEDEAEEKGMTVEALKAYKRMEAAADAARAKEQQSQEEAEFRNHLQKLAQQGESRTTACVGAAALSTISLANSFALFTASWAESVSTSGKPNPPKASLIFALSTPRHTMAFTFSRTRSRRTE